MARPAVAPRPRLKAPDCDEAAREIQAATHTPRRLTATFVNRAAASGAFRRIKPSRKHLARLLLQHLAMPANDNRTLWSVILAGGEGMRLRSLTRALHGEELPKQYANIV